MPVLAILLNAGCGSSSQPTAPAGPAPPTPTAVPGTISSTGPDSLAVGELYTSNWRSNDFRGSALRNWTASGDSFFFRWSTTAGDQIGRIGRTWTSPGFGVRVDDVRKPCVMSTSAEARDVTSGGFLIWSIYGWTHSENLGWPSPNGWNNEFYVTFRSWNGSYNGPNTHGGGYVSIGSVTIDGVDFDGYVNDMPWGTPNQTQWVIEARNATWPGVGRPVEGLRPLALEGAAERVRGGPDLGAGGRRGGRRLERRDPAHQPRGADARALSRGELCREGARPSFR